MKMTDTEICDKIHRLRWDRTAEVIARMVDYDTNMRDKIELLRDQCSHSQMIPHNNWCGVCGTECKFCGKVFVDE